ncbi:MAG: YggT family protein [Actinomycetota bacterium]|nr:YggT family protein [Actinomycetota bacterium]
MRLIQEILYRGLELYVLVIIVQIILSFFPISPGSPVEKANVYLHKLTDPVFRPLQRLIPPISFGSIALDLSPLVVLLAIQVLMSIVRPLP